MKDYIVRLELTVSADDVETAKEYAVEYFNQLTDIKNDEIEDIEQGIIL